MNIRQVSVYDSVDGKSFWKEADCLAHEKTLNKVTYYKLRYPNYLTGDDLYEIFTQAMTWEYKEGGYTGPFGSYEDGYNYNYHKETKVGHTVHGNHEEVIKYICDNFDIYAQCPVIYRRAKIEPIKRLGQ